MKRLPFLFFLMQGIVSATRAETVPPPSDRIREGEVKQQQLRGEAQQIVEQLDSMLGEYERNGLGGEETKTIQTLRDSVQRLSVDEMRQVVELLEKARGARSAGEAKQRVSDAYTSQKEILTQMQKLLAEHLRNQQTQEIAAQLAKLAERQAANLQNGISLGQWSGGRKPENFEAAMQANLQGQQAEQTAIAEELRVAARRIAAFAKDPGNAEAAARLNKGLAAINQVQPKVDTATDALKNGQLFKAVEDEKIARDAMRRLAREIAPPQDRVEALRAAQRELARMIDDQAEMAKEVATSKGESETLENKQGNLAGKGDELAQSLAKDTPAAAQDVKASVEKMQETRGAILDKNKAVAAKNAQDALAGLQAAEAKVRQELAKEEALAGKSGDPAKDLQALQKRTEELAGQQAAAAQNPDKSSQAPLAKKIEEAAQQAAKMAAAAAPALQQAAANAQRAAQAAQAGQAAPAAQAQQAAAQNLAQAAQQIAEQAAAAQQAQQQLAAAQQGLEQLAEIIAAEQKLQVDTTKSVTRAPGSKPAPRSAFHGQAAQQQTISEQTASLQKSLPPELAPAGPSLHEAQDQMHDAKGFLEKPDGKAAQLSEQKALDFLYEGQAALQKKAEEAQLALGQDPNAPQNANAMQQVAAQLAQAQAALANADRALQQAQQAQAAAQVAAQQGQPVAQKVQQAAAQKAAQQASAQLAQAAAQAGQVAARGQAASAPAQQGAQSAAQAAAQAAVQAAAQDIPGAQAQSQAAQQALAQAQAALAQAQSGVTAANTPGTPGSPGPGKPGSPGKPPGPPSSQPGKTPGPPAPGQPGTEAAQADQPAGNEVAQTGSRTVANRKASFAALPPRERAIIEQAQGEKYPEEYSAQVEQYLLNLARESAAKK
jgi:hypothetical protein